MGTMFYLNNRSKQAENIAWYKPRNNLLKIYFYFEKHFSYIFSLLPTDPKEVFYIPNKKTIDTYNPCGLIAFFESNKKKN